MLNRFQLGYTNRMKKSMDGAGGIIFLCVVCVLIYIAKINLFTYSSWLSEHLKQHWLFWACLVIVFLLTWVPPRATSPHGSLRQVPHP